MTKTSETTVISALHSNQAASFSPSSNAVKMYFCVPSVRPCLHHNYGAIWRRHAYRDCIWPIIFCAGLYTTCRSERVLVVVRFNATFLPLRPYCEKMRTSFLKDAERSTTYGWALWCSFVAQKTNVFWWVGKITDFRFRIHGNMTGYIQCFVYLSQPKATQMLQTVSREGRETVQGNIKMRNFICEDCQAICAKPWKAWKYKHLEENFVLRMGFETWCSMLNVGLITYDFYWRWYQVWKNDRLNLEQWFPTFFISRPHLKTWHKLATPFKNTT